MQTQIIDGRKIKNNILEGVKEGVKKLSFVPVFCDVLVGDNLVSLQYVKMKAKIAETVGIKFLEAQFPESISTEELISEIEKLNKIENMCGIIIQLPLPGHINQKMVLNAVDPDLDVDCLGKVAGDKFYQACLERQGEYLLGFPTALACLYILQSLNIDLKNKKIVVLGQGDLVGKPVSAMLHFLNLDLKEITNNTENKEKFIKEADVIISGMGNGKYLTGDMIKEGVILIDAGTSESNSAIVGDIDFESVKEKASFISPVPGGVGPVTVAMLLKNVLLAAQQKQNDKR